MIGPSGARASTTLQSMTKTIFTVTLSNGTIAKRKTERTYTHAVCSANQALSWCGSLALAQKKTLEFNPEHHGEVRIIEINA
jgi:hypothetical protein